MTTFAADITRFVELTQLKGRTVVRKLMLDTFVGCARRMPVDTGRARASIRIGIGRVDLSVEPERTESIPDAESFYGSVTAGEASNARGKLKDMQWGDTGHVSCNVHYARDLENGHSVQTDHAPDGIFGATFAEVTGKLQASIAAAIAAPGSI